jgi:hypothetical protein
MCAPRLYLPLSWVASSASRPTPKTRDPNAYAIPTNSSSLHQKGLECRRAYNILNCPQSHAQVIVNCQCHNTLSVRYQSHSTTPNRSVVRKLSPQVHLTIKGFLCQPVTRIEQVPRAHLKEDTPERSEKSPHCSLALDRLVIRISSSQISDR